LRYVEYRYTDPPWSLEFSDAGGRIEFERLNSGAWIVSRWWIRMPVIGLRPAQTVRIGRPLDQHYLAAVRETGAWVDEVTTLDRQSVDRVGLSPIDGMDYPTDPSTLAESAVSDPRTGFRIALNVNLLGTGSDIARFQPAPAFQSSVRLSTRNGLQVGGGIQFSRHGMRDARHNYALFQVFFEPRFALFRQSSRPTPFIGTRLGHAWERVIDVGAVFRATGVVFGGLGGATIRLDRRIAVETGITIGTTGFGNFNSSTDRRWNECVAEQGALGTPLPMAVSICSPQEFWSGPQLTPGSGTSGTGMQPKVEHADTDRRDGWRSIWIGVELRLGGR